MDNKNFTVEEAFRKVKAHLLYQIKEGEESNHFLEALGVSSENKQELAEKNAKILHQSIGFCKKSQIVEALVSAADSLPELMILTLTQIEIQQEFRRTFTEKTSENDPIMELLRLITER